MLKVYGYSQSINVRKVLWACEEICEPFEQINWGGKFASTSDPVFQALNPVKMVPVLDDHGVVIWESNVIVRYLASSRSRADLLPSDPAQRAHVEQWMDWQASDFNNSWRVIFQALVRRNPEFENPHAIEKSARQLADAISVLDGVLARTQAYIAGERFTVADLVIGLSVHRWKSIPYAWPEFTHVARYYSRLLERPGFQKHGRDGGP